MAAAVWLTVVVYLAQESLVGPNEMDDGLCLEFIDLVSRGRRPFWDFLDAYGPLHYQGPALFYALAGSKVWGVRLWVLLAKLATVAGTFTVARSLADRRSAWVALAFSTVLVGLPWQTLQTPYASLHAAPLIVGTCWLLLGRPLGARGSVILAALLTTAVLFIKVSSGAFLFAGGLLCTLCIVREPGEGGPPGGAIFRTAQLTSIGCTAALFLWFVREKPDPRLYLSLDVPLLVAACWMASVVLEDRRHARPFAGQLRLAVLYGGTTLGVASAAFLLYFGRAGGLAYVREMSTLAHRLHYVRSPRPLGEPGVYPAFNRWLWPELPWLVTACFILWWVLGPRLARSGALPADLRRRAGGLWVMTALGTFVLYSPGTEIHSVVAAWGQCPVFAVLLGQMAASLDARERAGRAVYAAGVALVLGWSSTIAVLPHLDRLRPSRDWGVSARTGKAARASRLDRLRFRSPQPPGDAPTVFGVTADVRDRQTSEAAMFIDEITRDGEEVLVLTRNQLITFESFTEHIGGRYRFLLYLARTGLLDRAGVEALAPGLVAGIIAAPPRVIVTEGGDVPPLLEIFPELRTLARRFRPARAFGSNLVLLRDDVALPARGDE